MEILLIYTCDEWKSHNSMSLVGAFTNFRHVKACIVALEKNGHIELDDGSYDKNDRYDGDYTVYDLNNSFKYLYIEAVEANKYNVGRN